MNLADHWPSPNGDSCATFMRELVRVAKPDVPATSKVLEIGCSEFDWIAGAAERFPDMDITGIDTRSGDNARGPHARTRDGNVMNRELFPPESFDWIVSISAIEHVGLGHYGDPKDEDGDTKAIANAFYWLKPGGWLVFDVPFNPEQYQVVDTSHREYDPGAIWIRLWVEALASAKAKARWWHDVYCKAGDEARLIPQPSKACQPFYYVGFAWQKV